MKLAHIKVEEIHVKYDIRYLHKYYAHIPTKNLDKLDQMLHKTKHGGPAYFMRANSKVWICFMTFSLKKRFLLRQERASSQSLCMKQDTSL